MPCLLSEETPRSVSLIRNSIDIDIIHEYRVGSFRNPNTNDN